MSKPISRKIYCILVYYDRWMNYKLPLNFLWWITTIGRSLKAVILPDIRTDGVIRVRNVYLSISSYFPFWRNRNYAPSLGEIYSRNHRSCRCFYNWSELNRSNHLSASAPEKTSMRPFHWAWDAWIIGGRHQPLCRICYDIIRNTVRHLYWLMNRSKEYSGHIMPNISSLRSF